METLAYLHLASAYEAPADTDGTDVISTAQNPKFLSRLKPPKPTIGTAIHLLSLTVAMGVLGITTQASAEIQQGDRGKHVTGLQERLAQLGYFKGNVTGYFGSLTKQAVIHFQQAEGLTPDGVVGGNTQASLGKSKQAGVKLPPDDSSSDHLVQLGDRGDKVIEIQQRLAAAGFSGGEKGVFDDATEEAIEQFQKAKGLKVDGIVGSQTFFTLPALSESNPQKLPSQNHHWYEDKSAPLTPFIH